MFGFDEKERKEWEKCTKWILNLILPSLHGCRPSMALLMVLFTSTFLSPIITSTGRWKTIRKLYAWEISGSCCFGKNPLYLPSSIIVSLGTHKLFSMEDMWCILLVGQNPLFVSLMRVCLETLKSTCMLKLWYRRLWVPSGILLPLWKMALPFPRHYFSGNSKTHLACWPNGVYLLGIQNSIHLSCDCIF